MKRVNWCEQNEVAFVPYLPLSAGRYFETGEVPDNPTLAEHALNWLLDYSPDKFLTPGTSRIEHLVEYLRADVDG